MRKCDFYSRYDLSDKSLEEAGIKWTELTSIAKDYDSLHDTLDAVGRFVVDQMISSPVIHSINYRLKETDHLLEKIVRKRTENSRRVITKDNYRTEIKDLIGIRALHLFKEDWLNIHKYICDNWDLAEEPVAFVRYGDNDRILNFYKRNNCQIREHKFGYRSVHYTLKTRPKNEDYLVEVQVRTLFEEAWGEIDHRVRYPYEMNNELLVRLSSILNRLAGDADELGSYMRFFKKKEKKRIAEHKRQLEEKNKLIDKLYKQIESLEIGNQEKEKINRNIADLMREDDSVEEEYDFPWLDSFLDSDLFKGIQGRIADYMKSEDFKPLEISEEDLRLLQKTQKELMSLMGPSPEKVEALLRQKGSLDMPNMIDYKESDVVEESQESSS
ncbi:RelA/SpoT domain-containing protein [Spirochaeta isovalerica]|uniref:PpGpp synthetase/RelA/SpoT-type nucleotidyltransferase n=1 Tax=Spirochaeta isovalerica TaxID=150 RepID=A0A841RCY4_9SPIO|nr:RelA/SpoT domain-containing protein [Spirochaeta isovalerica]MBB6481251.1 ppGpp synthetase/RelA/SpoT-type nucleotidyltransferase [Spirochaeta isovalerica]